ncbi:hypothetical protein EGT42_03935 [Acinetobacter haemolyticus]|nr:hypothetical protein EGT42_03935 [Acinetobacter haemolyticus]
MPAGFDRPYVNKERVLSLTLYSAVPTRPSFLYGRAEGGRLCACWFLCLPVCQPSFVLPPSIDSDLVEPLFKQRSYRPWCI